MRTELIENGGKKSSWKTFEMIDNGDNKTEMIEQWEIKTNAIKGENKTEIIENENNSSEVRETAEDHLE